MLSLNIYFLITIASSSYYFYDLYTKEDTFYFFSMHVLKSKFYFCLGLNFFIMIMVISGKLLINIFYGEVRLSELSQVIEKIRLKFFQLLVLFISFRPTIDIKKILLVVLYFFMAFLTGIAYKRGAYMASINETNKKKQMNIIFIYILLIYMNYLLYNVSNLSNDKPKGQNNSEFLIYYVFNCEFLFLFIKIVAKFYKLTVNITSINMDKVWDYRSLAFNIISTIKYSIKILCEFRFCYVLIKMRIFPIYFFIDVLKNAYHLIKLMMKIYGIYNNTNYVQSLTDYDLNVELANQGLINNQMTEEEVNKIRQEKVNICNICLTEIEKGKYLNCGHAFHLKCLKEWVALNPKCPICKSSIITDQNIRSRFFNERLGIHMNNNANNENNVNNQNNDNNINLNEERNQQQRVMTNEELLENIDLSQVNTNNLSSNNEFSFNFDDRRNENILLKTFLKYKKFKEKINGLKEKIGQEISDNRQNCESGAISYGLPTEAIYDRGIDNELKRLEIELVNQKFLKIYEEPKDSLMNFNEQCNQ